jgi:hypothetical protein
LHALILAKENKKIFHWASSRNRTSERQNNLQLPSFSGILTKVLNIYDLLCACQGSPPRTYIAFLPVIQHLP